jgi:MFS transporter, DHA1 family, multidrug resistance protein
MGCLCDLWPRPRSLISDFSVAAETWRWSLWEMLWISGPVFPSLIFFLPETSSSNILLRRAARLRALSGNPNLKSQSEIDQAKLNVRKVVMGNIWRPLQINALDPAVFFTYVYTALVYGIFYSFFEVFPLVYGAGNPQPGSATRGYGFNLGEMGLVFLCISVGVLIAIPSYFIYLHLIFEPEIMTKGIGEPERRLIPAIFASLLLPPGLFLFAWTANSAPQIHWIVSTIGVFLLLQCFFIYIPLTYPQDAASLFAGNDFFRSALATGAILFARPLFLNLGVGRGVTLLAGLTVGGIVDIMALYKFGPALGERSRFAAH